MHRPPSAPRFPRSVRGDLCSATHRMLFLHVLVRSGGRAAQVAVDVHDVDALRASRQRSVLLFGLVDGFCQSLKVAFGGHQSFRTPSTTESTHQVQTPLALLRHRGWRRAKGRGGGPASSFRDLDAFFAAVETIHHGFDPAVPLIIGSDPKQGRGRGIVSTCNYAARTFGIRSAMPVSEAWRRCPAAPFGPAVYIRGTWLVQSGQPDGDGVPARPAVLFEQASIERPTSTSPKPLGATGTLRWRWRMLAAADQRHR